jgi:hypothetical protein
MYNYTYLRESTADRCFDTCHLQLHCIYTLLHQTLQHSVNCSSDISNPTPVYVVQGGEAVLQCGFESNFLDWYVHNGGSVDIIESGAHVPPCTTYTGIGFDIPLVQQTLPIH